MSKCASFFRPSVLGVMTAAHVEDFVKTLAVGHERPPFSHQHSCRLVSYAHSTSIQIRIQQLISTTRLKHLHFRQLPRLTGHFHTKRPPVSSNCVANFSAARTILGPLYKFWFVLSLTSKSFHRHRHHSAQETRNQQTVGQLSVSRPAAPELPLTRQQLTSSIS